jgi:uncharacterized protein (TIGR02246 family)
MSSAVSSGTAMVEAMCKAADAGDAATFGSYFAEDAVFRFANAEPLVGRAAVEASTAATVELLPWVHHRVDQVAEIGDQLFCRFTIETAAPDGTELALPCVTVIQMTDGLITDYRVHMDITPALA